MNESVLWGWRPLLDPAGLARGVHSLGHPTRMRRLVERLLKGGFVGLAQGARHVLERGRGGR